MATSETGRVTTADDRAWELFFEALDADSDSARRVPPGAAIVAADAANRDDLLHRYHADRRSVVLVHEDGRTEIRRPPLLDWELVRDRLVSLAVWLRRWADHRVRV